MAEGVDNLMLKHLKRFQATLDRIERTLDEHTNRFASLESGQAVLVQHIAHFSSVDAARQLGMDNINRRLDRVERRLDLTEQSFIVTPA